MTSSRRTSIFRRAQSPGFTLIELLVVIAIIGLLASIISAAVNNARLKARDARRLTDIKQIKTGLDLYFSQGNGYPDEADFQGILDTRGQLLCSGSQVLQGVQDPLYPTFTYDYQIPDGATTVSGCGGTNNLKLAYEIHFILEGTPGVTYVMNEDGQFTPPLPQQ